MSQKSYNETPTLFLISTPIGNMEDITMRSLNTLKLVDVIFAEDTRVITQLLKFYKLPNKPLIANHNFNEAKNNEKLLTFLRSGNNVGLVTDRGTPVISDPGFALVKTAILNHYNVVALPGPTALIPALITSGLSSMPFLFYGFLNDKVSKARKELEALKPLEYTMIFYEAPHRITKTLQLMLEVFGDREASISREISKKFEEIYRGKLSSLIEETKLTKGELVIVVSGNKEIITYDMSIKKHVDNYIEAGETLKEAMKLVAKDRHLSKSIIYREYYKGSE